MTVAFTQFERLSKRDVDLKGLLPRSSGEGQMAEYWKPRSMKLEFMLHVIAGSIAVILGPHHKNTGEVCEQFPGEDSDAYSCPLYVSKSVREEA